MTRLQSDIAKDITFAKHDIDWPMLNILPLKRVLYDYDKSVGNFGFLIADDKLRTTIYFGNVFEVSQKRLSLSDIRKLPHKTFNSLEELFHEYMID